MDQHVLNIHVNLLHKIVLKWVVQLMKIQIVLIVAVVHNIKIKFHVHMILIIIYVCGKVIHVL
jgi:hypothetical protein